MMRRSKRPSDACSNVIGAGWRADVGVSARQETHRLVLQEKYTRSMTIKLSLGYGNVSLITIFQVYRKTEIAAVLLAKLHERVEAPPPSAFAPLSEVVAEYMRVLDMLPREACV